MPYYRHRVKQPKPHVSHSKPPTGTGLPAATKVSLMPSKHPSHLTRNVLVTKSNIFADPSSVARSRTIVSRGPASYHSTVPTIAVHSYRKIDPSTGLPHRSHHQASHVSTVPITAVSAHPYRRDPKPRH